MNRQLSHVTSCYSITTLMGRTLHFINWALHVQPSPQFRHQGHADCIESDTSVNPMFFNSEQSPLEGPSAILLKELTLASQQVVLSWVSISIKICAIASTVAFSEEPLIRLNFVPSLSTSRKDILFANKSVQRQ